MEERRTYSLSVHSSLSLLKHLLIIIFFYYILFWAHLLWVFWWSVLFNGLYIYLYTELSNTKILEKSTPDERRRGKHFDKFLEISNSKKQMTINLWKLDRRSMNMTRKKYKISRIHSRRQIHQSFSRIIFIKNYFITKYITKNITKK